MRSSRRRRASACTARRGRGRAELRVLVQDRALETLQLRAGIHPELFCEQVSRVAVERECVGLTTREVQRAHQLAAWPLPQTILLDERFELGNRRLSRGEARVEQLCDRIFHRPSSRRASA